jgi:hypothetical protein
MHVHYIVKKWNPDCLYLHAEMVIEQLSQEPSKMQKLSSLIKLKFFITDWFQAIEASVL